MTLSNAEIIMLASPIGMTAMASLLAWWSYASVMRRRRDREASEPKMAPAESPALRKVPLRPGANNA